MDEIGRHNGRQVFYLSFHQKNWDDMLPSDNWGLLCIGHDNNIDQIHSVAKLCLEKNVSYICATGKYSDLIRDTFDYFIVKNKIDKGESVESPDDFVYSPLTIWDDNIDEEFWFALTTAYHQYIEIKIVICLDMTETGIKEKLKGLLLNINQGWLPASTE